MYRNWKIEKSRIVFMAIAMACVAPAFVRADQRWRKELDRSAASLQARDYAASMKIADHAIADMVDRLGEGDDEAFATALTHKALANAGLGNVDDALWYWYVAQEIFPAATKIDLSPFGASGEFLTRHPSATADVAIAGGIVPPTVVRQIMPKFPPGASRFGIAGDLTVQIVVDKNGQPTLPKIVRPLPAPTLSFVALEALKRWRFKPATRNGAPVSSIFDLQVHYKL